jgi:diguanylate cyclase (GGDEF)-like protein
MANLGRVLLVDSGSSSREVVARAVVALGGSLEIAATGEDALLAISREAPDLVLLASKVGKLDGAGLVPLLKGKSPSGSLPVVLLVEEHDTARRLSSLEAGADDCVFCPIDERELLPRLRVFARVRELQAQVAAARHEIERLVTVDDVTGTYGRRFIHSQVRLEWARAERYGEALSLVLLDLVDLADLRSRHGDGAATLLLKEAALRLADNLRKCDLVSHVSWSQFLVLMPNTTTVGAYFAAEKLRTILTATPFSQGGVSVDVGVALGVSTFQDGNLAGPEALLSSADEALAQAREKGTGSIVLFHPASSR